MNREVYLIADEYCNTRRIDKFDIFKQYKLEMFIREYINIKLDSSTSIDKIYKELDEVINYETY